MYYSNLILDPQDNFSIVRTLRLWCLPGHVYELRVPNAGKFRTISGYFSDHERLALHAEQLSDAGAPGVYLTLNPCNPALLGRALNRVEKYAKVTTADKDIVGYSLLLIDTDTQAPVGVSSTDAEHDAALDRSRDIRQWLAGQGFPDGVLADSGNGGHLQYRLDLDNTPENIDLVSRFLQALADRFKATSLVKAVDTTNLNPSRVCKLYGTWVRKGDELPDRPHRRSRVLEAPAELVAVPRELLVAVAGEPSRKTLAATEPSSEPTADVSEQAAWLSAFIERHDIQVRKIKSGGRWDRRWLLALCPFCKSTSGACLTLKDGKYGFRCRHNRCSKPPRKRWRDFRRHYEPHQGGKKSSAMQLVAQAIQTSELFTSPDEVPYAVFRRGERRETHMVRSAVYRRFLVDQGERLGFLVGRKTLDDAVLALESRAHKGPRKPVYMRRARVGSKLYVDLNNAAGQVVEITPDGWTVTKSCPVHFVRPENMAPLPTPERGGSLDALRPLVNVSPEEFPLLRGFILDCFKGVEPYTVLLINGEHGTAKTTLAKLIRLQVDPVHKAPVRRLPRNEEDLYLASERSAILCLDNVSSLPQWLSDAFASLATGGAHGVRTHYSQYEERVYGGFGVPICFNGIPDFAESADLANRGIRITCLPIPPEQRKDEDELMAAFQPAYAGIVGAIFDALSAGLRHYDDVQLPRRCRMARSERWIAACETGMGGLGFVEASAMNHGEMMALAIEQSPAASALLTWMDSQQYQQWTGRMSELHSILSLQIAGIVLLSGAFPKTPAKLSGELRRLTPALRSVGLELVWDRGHGQRSFTVTRTTGVGTGAASGAARYLSRPQY